jgi:ABC-type Fe3+ transport system permease subunit
LEGVALKVPFDVLLGTLTQSLVSAGVSLVLGVLLACGLMLWELKRGRRLLWIRGIFESVFSLPSSVLALSALSLIASSGAAWALGFSAVVLIHSVQNAPWIASHMLRTLDRARMGRVEALELLGHSTLSAWVHSARAQLVRVLGQAVSQVGLLCFLSFSTVMLLGAQRVHSVELELFSIARSEGVWSSAMGGAALVSVLGCALWIGFGQFLLKRATLASRAERVMLVRRPVSTLWLSVMTLVMAAWAALLLVLWVDPITRGLRGLLNHSVGLGGLLSSLQDSILLAVASACLASGVGGLAFFSLRTRAFAGGAWFLMFSPSLICSAGFLMFPNFWNPIDGGPMIAALALGLLFSPWAYWLFSEHTGPRSPSKRELLQVLGASSRQAYWWLTVRPTLRTAIGVFALVVSWSIGDVVAVSYFAGDQFSPLSVSLMRLSAQYRFDEAHAGVVIWVLACAAPLILASRFLRFGASRA